MQCVNYLLLFESLVQLLTHTHTHCVINLYCNLYYLVTVRNIELHITVKALYLCSYMCYITEYNIANRVK